MRAETRCVRAALTAAVAGEPLHSGPVFATAFHTPGEISRAPYSYARSHNPTWTALEAALSALEGDCAGVRVFGSGLAAVMAVFESVLRPGDTVVLPEDVYFGAREVLEEMFVPRGVHLRVVRSEELIDAAAGARLVWVETPSNPRMSITDLCAVSAAAARAGALVAVDNTTATPWLQRPLECGAEFSVCSDSKSMGGHSDILLGHVAVRNPEWLDKLDRHRTLAGAIAGPMEAWLLLRSLETLPLRMERSCANAAALARMLTGRSEVREVLYPGLETHPGHALAARQMDGFGAVLSFTLGSQRAAERFFERAALVTEATSFGGVTTTAERRARWGHDRIDPGLIRLSAGCEHPDDLIEDIAQALDGVDE